MKAVIKLVVMVVAMMSMMNANDDLKLEVNVMLGSYHTNTNGLSYNNDTKGVGFGVKVGDNKLLAGYYKNSYNADSFYVGYERDLEVLDLDFFVGVSIIHGYEGEELTRFTHFDKNGNMRYERVTETTHMGLVVVPYIGKEFGYELPNGDEVGIKLLTTAPVSYLTEGSTVWNASIYYRF